MVWSNTKSERDRPGPYKRCSEQNQRLSQDEFDSAGDTAYEGFISTQGGGVGDA